MPEPILEQRISLITLGVEDINKSLAFYRDCLGWKPSSTSSEDMIVFQAGTMAFGLYPRDKLAKDACLEDKPKDKEEKDSFCGITLAYCVREKEEVDRIFKKLESAGTKILKPAQEVF